MDVSIAAVAKLTGTSSRTLRHYEDVGLLTPSRIGANRMRYYDTAAISRLQRSLLLRQLGLGLPAIGDALAHGDDDAVALGSHIELLRMERQRLDRQIVAVERTIAALGEGRPIMAEEMLDGFDHTQYRAEVEQRWGTPALERSDRWWRGLGKDGQQAFLAESKAIRQAWIAAHDAGALIDSDEGRALAARHIAWIGQAWGGVAPTAAQVTGLAEMYVADERFAANYRGADGAAYVRDALVAHVGGTR